MTTPVTIILSMLTGAVIFYQTAHPSHANWWIPLCFWFGWICRGVKEMESRSEKLTITDVARTYVWNWSVLYWAIGLCALVLITHYVGLYQQAQLDQMRGTGFWGINEMR